MASLTLDPEYVIELWTHNGSYKIELWNGDITQLPLEQKVDILMVSAFPGDYSPMSGTVLGALKKNLGVSVMKLSEKKELDLRHHFSCWLSRPVEEGSCPFTRVLCFEKRRGGMGIPAQISDMFRVFVPVFNNQDHTVITPLLATGHQGAGKSLVLSAMIEAAAEWIFAGMPLRVFKIVMYEQNTKSIKDMFMALKKKYVKKSKKMKERIFNKKFDIYIAFNPVDKQFVDMIKRKFKQVEANIQLYVQEGHFKADTVWQDEIFRTMVASKRIIAVLSPAFMESTECLDQYNMAVCCNQLLGSAVLAPFYVQTINSLPSYMGLVQWIDCRIRKDGDTTELKVSVACKSVVADLQDTSPGKNKSLLDTTAQDKLEKFEYDVFISYSHKNPEQAEEILEIFKKLDPSIKVFYDRSSLSTGINWQHMLYQCVGECKCMIALISSQYLTSTVCNEEFNLALARHLCKDKGMKLIPVFIEDLKEKPTHFGSLEIQDGVKDFTKTATKLATDVAEWLKSAETSDTVQEPELNTGIYDGYVAQRCEQVRKQYQIKGESEKRAFTRIVPLDIPAPKEDEGKKSDQKSAKVDLAVVYANDATYLIGVFCAIIDRLYPGLEMSIHSGLDQKRMEALSNARKIVIFVSEKFLASDHFVHELHLSMNRQRSSKTNILYLIQVSPLTGRPFFPRILPYNVVMSDPVWGELQAEFLNGKRAEKRTVFLKNRARLVQASTFFCHHGEHFSMEKAVFDILESLLFNKDEPAQFVPLLVNVVGVTRGAGGSTTSYTSGGNLLQHGEEKLVQKTDEEMKKMRAELDKLKVTTKPATDTPTYVQHGHQTELNLPDVCDDADTKDTGQQQTENVTNGKEDRRGNASVNGESENNVVEDTVNVRLKQRAKEELLLTQQMNLEQDGFVEDNSPKQTKQKSSSSCVVI